MIDNSKIEKPGYKFSFTLDCQSGLLLTLKLKLIALTGL